MHDNMGCKCSTPETCKTRGCQSNPKTVSEQVYGVKMMGFKQAPQKKTVIKIKRK